MPRTFTVNKEVYAKNFHEGDKWIPAIVKKVTGPLSYVVALAEWRRHVDYLRARYQDVEVPLEEPDDWVLMQGQGSSIMDTTTGLELSPPSQPHIPTRYSTRIRNHIDRYSPSR